MAKSKTDDLFDTLRARGLRTRVARALSDAADVGKSGAATSQKRAMSLISDLRKLADELEDRITGGKTKTRSEAAQKAARTRATKATARSAAAKKGAATRKRAASTTKRSSSTTKRSPASSSGGTRRRTTTKKS